MMKLRICYKSYTNDPNVSHAGLGIAAINTVKALQQAGLDAQVWPLLNAGALAEKLSLDPSITHVVIQAPWIPTATLRGIADQYAGVQFAVTCHSNVGFLQTDPNGMSLMLDLLELEQATHNVHCAGNSQQFVDWIKNAYQSNCTYLPNLYFVDSSMPSHRPLWSGGLLRIGIFGAPRPQKNVLTGVAGAIEIAQALKAHTEIWVNRGRDEGQGKTILAAAQKAIERNPLTTYKEFAWAPWPTFRRFIGSMNLLIQASYSESFNQVSADGVATGVSSVVSPAIRWAPHSWQCDVDCASDVAHVGRALLMDPHAAHKGLTSLKRHNQYGVMDWKSYLKI